MKRLFLALLAATATLGLFARERVISTTEQIPPIAVPLVGNGHMGMVPSLDGLGTQRAYSITVHEKGSDRSVSKIRPVMSPYSFKVIPAADGEALKPVSRTLDMTKGSYTTLLESPRMTVSATVRSLRGMPFATMVRFDITARKDIDIMFVNGSDIAATDSIAYRSVKVGSDIMGRRQFRYNEGRDAVVNTSGAIAAKGCTIISADTIAVKLAKGESSSFDFVSIICSTADCADPWNESERQFRLAVREGSKRLIDRHEALWDELWKSDITVEGDDELQLAATTALYHLYSSIRPGSRRSIAPFGQSSQGYNGHIFWDADTWMLPVMAALNPALAKSMIDFRVDGIPAARRRAMGMGYAGTMFPWEADNNGEESTPTFAMTGAMEQHITACVANAAWQYYCASHDDEWLRSEGFPLMKECAEFWLSRVEPDSDGAYSIRNIIGADEYADGVDDNAFTNGAVKSSLLHTIEAAKALGATVDPRWQQVADGLRFHYFADGVMREHAAYKGEQIKQSDVTLLGYPLGVITDNNELIKNINYYESKLDPDHGPAMAHGVTAVTQSRAGRADDAARSLTHAYKAFARGPFMVLSETASSNDAYFLTGAGSLLQGLIFGYAGIDITPRGLEQVKSSLPKNIKRVTVSTPAGTFTNEK